MTRAGDGIGDPPRGRHSGLVRAHRGDEAVPATKSTEGRVDVRSNVPTSSTEGLRVRVPDG